VVPRDVTPIIAWIRNRLGGRKIVSVHRFEDQIASRSPPLPVLPVGPSHVMSKNWYCDRDGRRKSQPPTNVYTVKALPSGEKDVTAAAAVKLTVPKPGFGYNWATGSPEYKA